MTTNDQINKENFGMGDVKDVCHYSCSKLNLMNLLLLIIIIILAYMLLK
jgi:hypothetical protein